MAESRESKQALLCLCRALIPFMRAPPSLPHLILIISQRPYLLILPHQWVGLHHMNFGVIHLVHNRGHFCMNILWVSNLDSASLKQNPLTSLQLLLNLPPSCNLFPVGDPHIYEASQDRSLGCGVLNFSFSPHPPPPICHPTSSILLPISSRSFSSHHLTLLF